jgi:hypothetical protein
VIILFFKRQLNDKVKNTNEGDSMKIAPILVLSLVFSSYVFAKAECEGFKEQIKAKKGTCKSLAKEQRASCKEEIRSLKEQHRECKESARAQKKQ